MTQKFREGDEVIVCGNQSEGCWEVGHVGFAYEVNSVSCRVSDQHGKKVAGNWYVFRDLELVKHYEFESHTEQFKVGDKVKCLHPVVVCDEFKDAVGVVKEVGGQEGGMVIRYEDDLGIEEQIAYVEDDGVVLVEAANQEQDSVNHPSHYNESGIECIEAIRASLGPVGFQAYCKGNCMKYLWRYQYKNGLEDLRKAQVYLNWMIESVEENEP